VIPKDYVDQVGNHIENVRKSRPKVYKRTVPDEAVDECEKSHEAADGKNQKTSMEKFDDTGMMALVCRHDIPLFLANVDTPGEQQKYSVALLQHFCTLIPSQATIATLYDVGCVLDRSLHLVSAI
jgi:Kyakuja-Dileera-Zisupton transposase